MSKDLEDTLSNLFLFAVFWGVGGAIEENTRKGFNELVQKMVF
jgi:hypothetical protein